MPAACAADLREELLARVWGPTVRAASRWDAELAAEMDELAAARRLMPPDDWELDELVPDPRCGPPDGADAWLADLPAELLSEYLAATEDPPCREAIVAGRLPRQPGDGWPPGDGCGFAAGGVADELAPGPVLAGLAGDAWTAGLGRLSDDELIGVLRAARRLASWSAAMELAAVTDLATRREAESAGEGSCAPGEHIGDEIAAALTLTARAADVLLDLATALRRLPATMAALAAGRIDRYRATVIADELAGLGDEHAAVVEQEVLDHAPDQTTGQLRAAARRAVLAADPAAARERKERAVRDARVERWDEHAGTAALAGRDLPTADVLAADHNLSALAGSLRRAGVSGTMDQLRARAYLALLTGQPLTALTGRGTPLGDRWTGTGAGGSCPGGSCPGGSCPDGSCPGGPYPGGSGHGGSWSGGSSPDGSWPGEYGHGEPGPGELSSGTCGHGPLGAVNLTMPLATWFGLSDAPGHAAGYGPLDASDSRDLADRLAGQTGSRWCITLTGEDGRPVAHGCARTGPAPSGRSRPPPRRPPRGGGSPGRSPRSGGSPRRTATPPDWPADVNRWPTDVNRCPTDVNRWPADVTEWLAGIAVSRLETGDCRHLRESSSYRPPPRLRHLVMIRQPTCSFPGCRRPAIRCDEDHTLPYDQGGRTCECNLAPLCRRHHRAKQARGWQLTQPEPGTMVWITPSGRSYATGPAVYPV
jgi:Domain of unknown function (DUF222)